MSKKNKAFLYNFLFFAVLFVIFRVALQYFTSLQGFWLPLVAAVSASFLAPKFQATQTKEGEKLFMKSIFSKEIKEIK
jgi:hypothetical protein